METEVKPCVLIVNDDLFFTARIESTLRKLGYQVEIAGNLPTTLTMVQQFAPILTIVNFGSERVQPYAVVRQLKAQPNPAPILGFLSHVKIPAVRQEVREAGCDLLVANSALSLRLPQLVAKLAPLDGTSANLPAASQIADEPE